VNIAQVLSERAASMGDAPAIIDPARAVTFAELNRQSSRAAAQIARAGVRPGDPVLVVCPMSVDLYTVLIGLWRVGAHAVFLDPSAGRAHLESCCHRVPPRALVAVPRAHLLRALSPALRRVPLKLAVRGWAPGAIRLRPGVGDALLDVAPAAEDTPALVTFTSGSTGEPKAAVRTHGFLLAQHRVLADDLRLRPGQRDLATLPIFVLANLASGVTSVIPDADLRRPAAIDPAPVLRQIRALGPTRTAASPALLDRIARHALSLGQPIAPLSEIYTGGAPVFPAVMQRLHAAAPHARLVAVYGSTEAEPIACIAWDEIAAADVRAMESGAGLLAGRPVGAIDLRVLEDQWGRALAPLSAEELDRRTLSPGQAGEIVVAGPHVLRGYLGGRGDADTKVRVGPTVWHRTGDAGYLDPSGRLWLLGRCSARIVDGLGTVHPFAVECAAMTVAGVRRSALVSVRDRRVLAVELEHGAGDVRAALLAHLGWAFIAEVVEVASLPVDRRHNAKIDYPALRALLDGRVRPKSQ
jgi:acyl-CoA synthetase (AMP-forming)/AMP-acid ligase II